MLSKKFACPLEADDEKHDQSHEDDEEDETRQEDVGCFNSSDESDTLNSTYFLGFRSGLLRAVSFGKGPHGSSHYTSRSIKSSLLKDLNRSGREVGEKCCGSSSRRPLVPGTNILKKPDANDTHTPLEILSPRLDNGRQVDSSHTNHGLRLVEVKEGKSVRRNVSSSVRVPEAGGDSRSSQTQTGDDGSCPSDALLIDSFTIRKTSLETGNTLVCLGGIDVDADGCIKIRNSERNAYSYKVNRILSIF